MTHRLQLKKSRQKIRIFSCALINDFVMALVALVLYRQVKAPIRIFEGHGDFWVSG